MSWLISWCLRLLEWSFIVLSLFSSDFISSYWKKLPGFVPSLYVHIQASWSNQGSNQGSFIFSLVTTAATLESCICSGHLEINSRPECILSGHTDLVWGNTAFPSIFILPALDLWWIRAGRRAHRGVKYEMGAAVSATWLSVTQANHQGQW